MYRPLLAAFALATFLGALALAADPPAAPPPAKPKSNHVEKVLAVVAETEFTAVKPAKPRKLLIYSHCNGFNHGGGIECLKAAFEAIAKKTGAFECVISDDLENFEADKIQQFDAIFFNNTTGELFAGKAFDKSANPIPKEKQAEATERLRKNLVDYVKSGKGIAGNHGAADCSYKWAEWGQLIGGYFAGHPYSKIYVNNDDPQNPLNKAISPEGFDFNDEIYIFGDKPPKSEAYSRAKNRVLLSIDTEKSKITKHSREDQDYGLSWIKKVGEGRTFYCAFGHDQRAFVSPTVLKHFLAGVQYVLGDLPADATPRPKAAATPAMK